MSSELPVFLKWLDFVKWLMATVDLFPKKARFTISERLINHSLDVVEDLLVAKYSRSKNEQLKKINLTLEKIRILIRISFEQRYMPRKSYEQASVSINEVGKMLGGWIKQQEGS